MKLRAFLLFGALLGASSVYAVLPESVIRACLAPELKDHTADVTWQVMDAKTWDSAPIEVGEAEDTTLLELPGKEHPSGWLRTSVRLRAPKPTDAQPCPTQTLSVEARSEGIVSQMTVDFVLLKDAKLPPYRIRQWGNRIAIVAEAGDWYIAADEATATITESHTPERTVTLRVPNCAVTLSAPASASLLIGEGPLPPAP